MYLPHLPSEKYIHLQFLTTFRKAVVLNIWKFALSVLQPSEVRVLQKKVQYQEGIQPLNIWFQQDNAEPNANFYFIN